MGRVIAFIDGFNMYHALIQKRGGNRPYAGFRWLNYWRLAGEFLHKDDKLDKVYLFTAYVTWDSSKRERHKKLLEANRECGVSPVFGRFRRVTRDCKGSCSETYSTHEEKRTDVNIAVYMLELAFYNAYDKAILISGDSDMTPAVDAVRRVNPHIEFTVVLPIKRKGQAIRNKADYFREMRQSHLERSRLPNPFYFPSGSSIAAPPGWT